MKKNLQVVLMFFFALATQFAFAQERMINGTIVDDQGMPLPGVNVIVQNTNRGVQTDFDGHFSIAASTGEVLEFSYVGFTSQTVTIGPDMQDLSIILGEDAAQLDEVVVVGYGTQSKRQLTDNVAKLTSEDIAEVPTPSLQSSLSGKAAGVQVTQTNGKVEGGINIRIRGIASVGAGSEPLYVLDGVPLINNNESNNGAPTNPLLTLSSNEIESIDILKDASAAAVYGSRGANGVVIITTKKGGNNKGTFAVNYSYGISETANRRDWLNADQYIELFTEAAINSYGEADGLAEAEGTFDYLAQGTDWRNREIDTDWQDEIFRTGYTQNADFSASGGDERTSYFFSGAYNDTEGIIRGNNLDRITARANVSHQFSDKFNAGMNVSFSRTNIDRIANDNAFVNPVQGVAQSPLSPAYLENGEPNPNTLYANFLLQDKHAFYNTVIRRVTGRAFAEYKFLPSLKFNTDFGYDLFYQTEDSFTGSLAPFQSTNGEAYASSVGTESYVSSNYFTYSQVFDEIHDVEVVAGMEYNNTHRRFQSVTGIQFPTDDFQTINSAAEISAGNGITNGNRFLSYFARGTYALDGKYLFKASVRRDGSSRFGRDTQFGTFSAISGGWILSEENFLSEADWLSFLKLRASWGQTGNAQIGDYAALGLYGGTSYNQRPGIYPDQPANFLLSWESVNQTDIGVEYGFLNNRISGEIDYYSKVSKDLLFDNPLPGTSGFSSIQRNIGEMENSGVEFVLNTKIIQKADFTLSTSFNIAKNKNEVKRLPNDGADIISGQNIQREGESLNSFYLVEYAGVDPENGDALYYLNGKGSETTTNFNEANRVVAGAPYAEWIGGLTSNLYFHGIDFSFTFQGEWGASLYNGGGVYQSANGDYFDNQTADQMNRWQQPGDITDVPQARLYAGNGVANSTRYLEDADFIRLRNLTLGYTFPESIADKLSMNNLRVYFSGLNLLTVTDYEGYDPESRSDAGQGPGTTFYSAPAARTFSLGVNLKF
ncbi:MAG: TonB-dependent receptor [Zunongwangia sp.]|uniref:Outer membrane protein, probably involved in nutrient binding n=2 Tax=Zunongwangia profunda TaxID=398743 RepID=D5BG77_ZUNPS|nr:TonB-dependent receptor [Zunongwangia profunda]ADF51036.1 putative outer membrane protein, probably involved in nutrient binding [Zunongwangia profunda SM-A87]MAO37730.1 TonB-dependent receptor [Zunongwangia sp.]MAS72816.1 TonB-dependent receptor [Zunongwangia sp.]HCV80809.1 TonB-dependent receptor [Zunongwangia profunda]|tara:strand:- start:1609 stop:4602 length:2994 start_codon:yes stop_codon:yes gene_type:complete